MADKKKAKSELFKITKRDMIILIVLLLLAEIYLIYTFLYQPKILEKTELQAQLDLRSRQMQMLKVEYDKIDEYEANTKSLQDEAAVYTKQLRSYLEEEEMILSLKGFSTITNVVLTSVSFAERVVEPASTYIATPIDPAAQTSNTAETSAPATTAEVAPAEGAIDNVSGGLVISQNMDLSVKGTYETIYAFLKMVEDSERKLVLVNVVFSTSQDGGVMASLTMKNSSYIDDISQAAFLMEKADITPRDSLFRPYSGFAEGTVATGESAVASDIPNYYMMINPNLDNAQKVILGMYPRTETEVYQNDNAVTNAKLRITKDGDKYNSILSVGGKTFTDSSALTLSKGKLVLRVISSERLSAADMVSVKLDIDNQTETALKITVMQDDEARPRFATGVINGPVELE